jgi:hypothetical protein
MVVTAVGAQNNYHNPDFLERTLLIAVDSFTLLTQKLRDLPVWGKALSIAVHRERKDFVAISGL